MTREERDFLLLSLLDPEGKAIMDELLIRILARKSDEPEEIFALIAAAGFDRRAESLPLAQKVVSMQIAAALRRRANVGLKSH